MTSNDETSGSLFPSHARLGAAARRGLFPRSRLLVTGASLLAGAVALALAAESGSEVLARAFRDVLGGALLERPDAGTALEGAAGTALAATLLLLTVPALAAGAAAAITAAASRRRKGTTAVPLPPERPRDFSPALPRLAALALAAVTIAWVLGRHRELPAAWLCADPDALRGLVAAVVELLAAVGASCALAGLAELALVRTRLWSALALTRSEALRDRRAGGGDGRARGEISGSARREGRP